MSHAYAPPVTAREPGWTPPPGTTDCHMHIFGPAAKYPFAEPRDYSPTDCPMPLYREMCRTVGIERTVVVHPSVYGFDNRCSEQAVRDLGRDGRGVAVLPPDVTAAELRRLDAIGFRGARFNMVSAGGTPPDALEDMAAKLAEFGWHIQVFTTSAALPTWRRATRSCRSTWCSTISAGPIPRAGRRSRGSRRCGGCWTRAAPG